MPKLTLRGWLVAGVLSLIVLNVGWRLYAGWGLITLSANKRPLSEVIAQIERQAHVSLKTNLAGNTPVSLRVERAPLTEVLERLAAVTDARWRLVYAFGKTEGAIRGAVSGWQSGSLPEGWRWFDQPMPFGGGGGPGGDLLGGGGEDAAGSVAPPDPRRAPWRLSSFLPGGAEAGSADNNNTLNGQLERASLILDAGFLAPADWNPAVAKPPAAGTPLAKAAPRLASAAGGRAEEMFLLINPERRRGGRDNPGPPPDDNPDGGPPPVDVAATAPRGGDRRGDGGNREGRMRAMGERMQARVDALPPDQRKEAQARLDAERAFWEGLRVLPPEERRAKMEARMNDPAAQARMEERSAARDALRTPEQRAERYRNYVQRRTQRENAASR